MADRFWVGGGSSTNWNATGNTNWSATDGGPNNASVPTTTDVAIFNGNSGSGTSVISASITIQKLVTTNYTGTITHNSAVTLTLNTGAADSLIFGSGMTYTPAATTSLITFTHTSGTADITSNGKRLGALTINGAGGTTRLLDALRVDLAAASTITLTSGTFNSNGFQVDASLVAGSGATTRVLTMGDSTWNVGLLAAAATTPWNFGTATNLTINANTSTLNLRSNSLTGIRTFAGGARSYNNVYFKQNSAKGTWSVTGANTFANLYIEPGNWMSLATSTIQTVTNAFTWTGTPALPIGLVTAANGTQATITSAAACTGSWLAIRDILFNGGGSFTATNSFNHGNSAAISISPPTELTVASIVAAVWDEPTAGNVTEGTFGAQLKTVVDAIDAKTTNLPSDPADASVIAGLIAATEAKIDIIDTTADAIKAKTDNLAFTVAGQVDANVQYVNDVQVTGVGSEADPWGP